jgi:alpha/beta hydrolase fold
MPTVTDEQPFPAGFEIKDIATNGTTLSVRIGGQGPAVVLLHGYGETGDMWAPLATELADDYTVVAPDLRGMGLSARPAGGYDKKTQGQDIAGLLDTLKIERTRTTSATWSAMPSPLSIPTGSSASSSWMRRCLESGRARIRRSS